jgi:hypothetical protein
MEKMRQNIKPVALILFTAAAGFSVNYVWEMVQMPLFIGMKFSDPYAWLICARASVGDAAILLVILSGGRLLFGSVTWFRNLSTPKLLYLILAGAFVALGIEKLSIVLDRWEYSHLMPVIPGVQVGLVPVIQMVLLPYVSFTLGFLFAARYQEEKTSA